MKKKLLTAAVCLMLGLGCLVAQDRNTQRRAQQRAPRQMDAVVDTAVLNRMQLDEAMMTQILALQNAKQTEQNAMLEAERNNRTTDSNGKRVRRSDDEREAMRQQQEEFKAQYRADLHLIMGDSLYISYLEKLIDARSAMQMRPNMGQTGGNNRGGNDFGGGNRGGEDFGGGFGGGDF
jgi:hypothetical protein